MRLWRCRWWITVPKNWLLAQAYWMRPAAPLSTLSCASPVICFSQVCGFVYWLTPGDGAHVTKCRGLGSLYLDMHQCILNRRVLLHIIVVPYSTFLAIVCDLNHARASVSVQCG